MFDFNDLKDLVADQDRGADLVIRHPATGDATDIVLTVAGPDSDVQRRARLKLQDELYAFKGKVPAEEMERLELDRLARCIIRWKVSDGGKDVSLTHSAAVQLLNDMGFVRDQLSEFAASRIPYFERLPLKEEVAA